MEVKYFIGCFQKEIQAEETIPNMYILKIIFAVAS
jgi:hypothetical protein